MDSQPKIKVKLDVENIGPHNGNKCIHYADDVDSLKAIFYASNGTGKSFISRIFRLLSPENSVTAVDDLLTLGQSSGSMAFNVSSKENPVVSRQVSVCVNKGAPPTIQNNTGYFFHVFNSEYVEENIKPRNYSPDGNIEGYILGKVQIDLTEEKKQEAQLINNIASKEKGIDQAVIAAQKELRDNGIRANQKEYTLISKERLRNVENVICEKSFDEILAQLKALERLPDNLPDIVSPIFRADSSVFDEIVTVLSTSYPKSDWDEQFASQVKRKRNFITEGLSLASDEEICPFCGQSYNEDALSLIHGYKAFLSDKEAQILRQLDNLSQRIASIVSSLHELCSEIKLSNAEITKLKQFFPSINDVELIKLDTSESVIACFVLLDSAIKDKQNDISSIVTNMNGAIANCKSVIENAVKACSRNSVTIKDVNALKNNSNTERLNLRRDLCNAQYLRACKQLAGVFAEIAKSQKELDILSESIVKKEEQARVSKKEKVYETLEYFLNRFFAGKYSIDKDTFLIKFQNTTHANASSVLSDGEKSIVAFCFYLASTHLLMSRDDDYSKLFFIIDDPISSMDFHYVYAVAQVLRDIKTFFGITSHDRMYVFTHNLEFYSIITRNHIIAQAYVMKPGRIEKLKEQLLMPYESHLRDIVNVASGAEPPTHTIGNSIRHVLETVSRFEYPQKKLETYISENQALAENSCVFTLCQDLSHGAVRNQPPFDEQVIKEACKAVVSFMNIKYQAQIDALMTN